MRLKFKPGFRWFSKGNMRLALQESECLKGALIVESDGKFEAYPHGDSAYEEFDSLAEAHDYLLRVGSESPLRDVTFEPFTIAEGEGPALDEDAEACRAHRASLRRIQVVDAPVNMCRCVQTYIEPLAPRSCAVDRLEAAGYTLQVNQDFRRIEAKRKDSVTVFMTNVLGNGRWDAWIDGALPGLTMNALFIKGDESPGLNAALESLLSKPVGAVTVAQILGVA